MFTFTLAALTLLAGQSGEARITNRPLSHLANLQTVRQEVQTNSNEVQLLVRCHTARKPSAFFGIVTDSAGHHPDPTGLGPYAGGRFAADGQFSATVPPGPTELYVWAGPDYLPQDTSVTLRPGYRTVVDVTLTQWFSPENRGWFGGDNHVHAAHDPTGDVKSSLAYAGLQARANGLSFVTQASSEFPFDDHYKLSTPDFLLRRSLEDRQGSFAGHLNSPGVELPQADREATMHAAMPAMITTEWVHAHGAAIIHTHTMVPPHQLHWMGAAEAYSYSILGVCPDAMDLDGDASEHLWYMVLNLGNKVSCSGSTDAALERTGSPAPGARRMYVQSRKFDYEQFVKGIRAGRLFATNAGPVFAFFGMDGHGLAETVKVGAHRIKIELHSLYPLRSVELISRGNVLKKYKVEGLRGETTIEDGVADQRDGWYAIRVHDQEGNWAITSPIYVRTVTKAPKSFTASILMEIGNFTRLSEVRKNFMAHFIATVSPEDPLAKLELLRDNDVMKTFTPDMGDHVVNNKTPVTETFGEYSPGWLWYPAPTAAVRFQCDWDVTQSAWYRVRATTKSGRIVNSDAMYFDAENPMSNETSVANLFGKNIEVRYCGYGESVPLADAGKHGDDWWYPNKTFYRISTVFDGSPWTIAGGDESRESIAIRHTGTLQ